MKRYNLAVKPGTTKNNKTGGWRTFRPRVDHEKCIGCGICGHVCPEGVCFPSGPIGPDGRRSTGQKNSKGKIFYEIDLDYCKGCGICAKECPVKAIIMEMEKK